MEREGVKAPAPLDHTDQEGQAYRCRELSRLSGSDGSSIVTASTRCAVYEESPLRSRPESPGAAIRVGERAVRIWTFDVKPRGEAGMTEPQGGEVGHKAVRVRPVGGPCDRKHPKRRSGIRRLRPTRRRTPERWFTAWEECVSQHQLTIRPAGRSCRI